MAVAQRDVVSKAAAAPDALPTAQAGDILLAFALRDGVATAPTNAPGWTSINNAGGSNGIATRVSWKAYQAGDTAPTFTNATAVVVASFSGVNLSAPIGASDFTSTGTSDTITLPALTLTGTDGGSYVTGAYLHRNSLSLSTPDQMTEYVDAPEQTTGRFGYSGIAAVSAFAARTVSATLSAQWRSVVIELVAAATVVTGTASASSSATAAGVQVAVRTASASATSSASASSTQVAVRTAAAGASSSATAAAAPQAVVTGTATGASSATATSQVGQAPVTVTALAQAASSATATGLAAYSATGNSAATSAATAGVVQVAIRTGLTAATSNASAVVRTVAFRTGVATATGSATADAAVVIYRPAPNARTLPIPAAPRVLPIPVATRTLIVRSSP